MPDTEGRRKGLLSDAVCISAFALLIFMTVCSYLFENRLRYQLNTGIFTAVFCLVPMLFRRTKVMALPLLFVIVIEVAIFLHGYGVLLMQYDDLVWYDTVTHTVSSVVVGLCVFYALMVVDDHDEKVMLGKKGMSIFIVLTMLAFSVYWEVFELVVDIMSGTNMQYSPFDTMRDMLSNTLGGIFVAIYVRWFLGRHPDYDVAKEFSLHPKLMKFAGHTQRAE
ncbi:MAG: hypothetical protein AB7S83_06310 [Candidatus Methanomethylophilaceae archaeon]